MDLILKGYRKDVMSMLNELELLDSLTFDIIGFPQVVEDI
jgi:hypothetical protein